MLISLLVCLIYVTVKRDEIQIPRVGLRDVLEIMQSIIINKREVIATAEDSSKGMF